MPAKHLTLEERSAYQRLEDVVGCKWSAAVVGALQRGVNRPGKLERYIPGISTKVLTERLRKLLDYGLIKREDHSDVALHVEYSLTPTGLKLAGIIEQLHTLQTEHTSLRPAGFSLTADAATAHVKTEPAKKKARVSASKILPSDVKLPKPKGTRS